MEKYTTNQLLQASTLKQSLLIIVILLSLPSCSRSLEHIRVPDEGKKWSHDWKLGHQYIIPRGPDASNIKEFIPYTENIHNWSRIVTIQYFDNNHSDPKLMMDKLENDMRERCSDTDWKVIRKMEKSILYEWQIKDCHPESDQHEISRLISGKEGLHRISYTEKTREISNDTRKEWIDRLSGSFLEKEGEKVYK